MATFQFILILTIYIAGILAEQNEDQNFTIIYVSNSKSANDSEDCLNGTVQCKTIEFVMKKNDLNYTKVIVEDGVHSLSAVIKKRSLYQFSLEGIGPEKSTIKCITHQSGFYFGFSEKVAIHNLTFDSCGSDFPSTNIDNRRVWNVSTALFIEETKEVNMVAVQLRRSLGYGAVFYDVVGSISFKRVVFSNNYLVDHSGTPGFSSGGGIYIEFRPKCNRPENAHFLNSNGSYVFDDCKFINNIGEHSFSAISYSNCNQFTSFGRGGGISFFSRGNAKNNSLTIKNCTFQGNKALWGGGIFAEFDDNTGSNKIMVNGSHFAQNNVTFGGGGMRIGVQSSRSNGGNSVSVNNTKFEKNLAVCGGAFSQYRSEGAGKAIEKVTMTNCNFSGNAAQRAGAISLVLCQLDMTNTAISRSNHNFDNQGEGSIYIYSSTVNFFETNVFESNHFSAAFFEESYAINYGHILFVNNTGGEGGALGLYGDSVFQMMNGSKLRFENNTARKRGGAMYVEMPVSSLVPLNSTELQMRSCFFLFGEEYFLNPLPDKFYTSISFIGNYAPASWGSNIYADTISVCRKSNEQKYNNSALKWKNFHYIGSQYADGRKTVVTMPIEIIGINVSEWNVYPGLKFSPTVILLDENGNSVYSNLHVTVKPEKEGKVRMQGSKLFLVKEKIDNLQFIGLPSEKYSVHLETTNGPSVSKVISGLTVRKCPVGYYLNDKKHICECISEKFDLTLGVTKCESSSSVFILKARWGDPLVPENGSNCDFARYVCPKNYCQFNKTNQIDRRYNKWNQCSEGRKPDSVLCGECKEGYGVVFGSEFCQPCKNDYGVFWLLLLLLILTVVVIVIMIFNIDTYATSLNAFLYSYQVIPLCTQGNTTLDVFMQVLIGLATLSGSGSVGAGVCLWKSMTDLEKMFLNYLIPTYMIFSTYVLTKISLRFNNNCFLNKSTMFKSFVFISVLAYSDFTRITFDLLHPVKVRGQWVLYKAGFVEVFKGEHIPFAIIAVLVLIFIVVLFPFLIMFSRFLTTRPTMVRFKGVIDTFNEPFRPLEFCDFFSVFYFINRLVLLLIYVYIPPGSPQDTVFAVACVLILLVFVNFKPYWSWEMNLYDSILLTNIAALAIINLGLDGIYGNRSDLQQTAHALTYFPLICAVVKLGIYCYRKWNAPRGMFVQDSSTFNSIPFRVEESDDEDSGSQP